MKKYTLIFCCFWFFTIGLNAQEEFKGFQIIDSLKIVLENLPAEDTLRFRVLEDLGYYSYLNLNDSSFMIYGEQYLALAKLLDHQQAINTYYQNLYMNYFSYDEALFLQRNQEAKTYFESQKDTIGIINSTMITAYYMQTTLLEYDKAIHLLKKAIELSQKINYNEGKLRAYSTLMNLMQYSQNHKDVIVYADKVLSIPKVFIADVYEWKFIRADALSCKASALVDLKQYDSIETLQQEALDLFLDLGDYNGVHTVYNSLALYYFEIDNVQKAVFYLEKVEQFLEAYPLESSQLSHVYSWAGMYFFDKEQYDSAKIYLEKAILRTDIERQKNPRAELYLFPVYEDLSLLYEKEGNYEAALNHFKQYHIYKDSTNILFNNKTIKEFNIKYETQEKEKAIALLTARNQTYLIAFSSISLFAVSISMFLLYIQRKNQQISQQKSELEQLNTTKDRLFAIISHDLRKPALAFRGISKKVKFLIQQQEFETLDKYGASLEKAAYSLNGLLDNLLNWALQQRDVLPYNPTPINLAEATQEIYDLFHRMAADKNIHLKMNIPESTIVFADLNAYATIVRNLMDNAIKYTPEGGTIDLSAEKVAEKVAIKVADTGTGISAEKIEQLFDLQKNKSSQGTAGEMGSGLGLTLVKDLVALNKGTIKVESEVAKGTTFEVLLPAA